MHSLLIVQAAQVVKEVGVSEHAILATFITMIAGMLMIAGAIYRFGKTSVNKRDFEDGLSKKLDTNVFDGFQKQIFKDFTEHEDINNIMFEQMRGDIKEGIKSNVKVNETLSNLSVMLKGLETDISWIKKRMEGK